MGLLVICTELCTGTTYENGIVKLKGGRIFLMMRQTRPKENEGATRGVGYLTFFFFFLIASVTKRVKWARH